MRKIILMMMLLMFPVNSYAFIILDIDYTGLTRERIDTCGYGCGFVTDEGYVSNLMYSGGTVANNSVGYAQQIKVDDITDIDYLLASAHIQSDGLYDLIGYNELYFKLYGNTNYMYRGDPSKPYPDIYSLSLVSMLPIQTTTEEIYDPDFGWRTVRKDGYYYDVPVPFDITLSPGVYWIAQERYPGNENLAISWTRADDLSVKFAKEEMPVATYPEPTTFYLLSFGLLGLLRKRNEI